MSCLNLVFQQPVNFLCDHSILKLVLEARLNGGGVSIWEELVRHLIAPEDCPKVTNVISFYKPGFSDYHLDEKGVPHQNSDGVEEPLWFTDKCK